MTIGEATQELRKALGESQQKFSNRLGNGLATVARWEGGVAKPTSETLVRLYELALQNHREDLAAIFAFGAPPEAVKRADSALAAENLSRQALPSIQQFIRAANANITRLMYDQNLTPESRNKLADASHALSDGDQLIQRLLQEGAK